jgi:hypothetical protein
MNKKTAVLIAALVGAIFFTVALLSVVKSVKLKKNGIRTEAVVQSVKSNKGSKTVTVLFNTPDGTEVTAKASRRHFTSTGERIPVWYDAAFPQKIDFGDTVRYNMRGVAIGGFLFILMMYFFIKYTIADIKNKNLVKSGMKIEAEFVSIDRDERIKIGGQNPWIIKCKWLDSRSNKQYFYKTKPYTIDPSPYLNGRYHLDVYINPADPAKYFIDTSFMPKGDNTIG